MSPLSIRLGSRWFDAIVLSSFVTTNLRRSVHTFVVAAGFFYGSTGSGEVGRLTWRRGSGSVLVLDVYGVHRAYRSDNGTGIGARVP